MSTKIVKVDVWTPEFLGGTIDVNWLLRKFPASSKQIVIDDVLILHSSFLMT